MRSVHHGLVASLLALAGAACEGEMMAAAPVRVCREVATQCQLPDGPLGVCERAGCGAGEAPPCFVCTPQH